VSGANERAEVFTALAKRAIDRGDFDVARGFAAHAETYARMSVTTTTRVQGFTALARAYAMAGKPERAENIAGVALSPDGEPSAEEHLAMTFVEMGERERAVRIAHKFSPLVRDHLLVELRAVT
jgi:lipopolysaccharide biosynthesis regulator YciM